MALPFLPGNVFNRNLGKEKFHKSHLFEHRNTISFMFGDHKPGIGGDPLPGQRQVAPVSRYPAAGEGPTMPAWIAFDKQVLSFDAYYQEAVVENKDETYRTREVKIYFYLEDDSIQVIEPRHKNSGLAQGTVLRRHRVTRPAPHDNLCYTVHDFNVGLEVNFYGVVYKIVGCDEFTHNFLRKLGVNVAEPVMPPENPYTTLRKAMAESMQPLRPYERYDTLRQFLNHDRHVLRFYCFWDDTESLHGDAREMVLHYFLADDTIEISEMIPTNAGRDSGAVFLRRRKLPKRMDELPRPGDGDPRTVLNVFGKLQGGHYILDSLKTGAVHIDCYKDSDLTIGTYINVFGRKFLICDCDEFTKEYYTYTYGAKPHPLPPSPSPPTPAEFTPIFYSLGRKPMHQINTTTDTSSTAGADPPHSPPPPERISGAPNDSVSSRCKFEKFLELDRLGFESHILRFQARMQTEHPIDRERGFIISYFLSDDTMNIFEPTANNSGICGGLFLERSLVRQPLPDRFSGEPPVYYTAQDLFVGAVLNINGFIFELEDCDEYAWGYIEQHCDQFPVGDVGVIVDKLRRITRGSQTQVRAAFTALDPDNTGHIEVNSMANLLTDISHGKLSRHEVRTLMRHYADRPVKPLNVVEILAVCQQQLRKRNFENFMELTEALSDVDRDSLGRLTPEEVRSVCLTLRLPLPDQLLRAVIHVSGIDADGLVNYAHLVANINWRHNPVKVPNSDYVGSVERDWLEGEGAWEEETVCGGGGRAPPLPIFQFSSVRRVVISGMIEDILVKERVPREVVYN